MSYEERPEENMPNIQGELTQPAFKAPESRPPGLPVIKVFGVGGGGCNAIGRMPKDRLQLVEYYGINTDAQHLARCDVNHRVVIGEDLTRGLGSGREP